MSAYALDNPFLGCSNGSSQHKKKEYERESSCYKGRKASRKATRRHHVSGQTGQDRAGSAKPGKRVGKAEECKAQEGTLPSVSSLGPHKGISEARNGFKSEGQYPKLNQA